jgi:hypothetical protein
MPEVNDPATVLPTDENIDTLVKTYGVRVLAAALADKLANPFLNRDMNRSDIDWNAAYDAMRAETEDDSLPGGIAAFLAALSGHSPYGADAAPLEAMGPKTREAFEWIATNQGLCPVGILTGGPLAALRRAGLAEPNQPGRRKGPEDHWYLTQKGTETAKAAGIACT